MIQKQMTYTVYNYEGKPIAWQDNYSDAQEIFVLDARAAYFVIREFVIINNKQVYSSDLSVYTRNDFEEEIKKGSIVFHSDTGEKFTIAPDGSLKAEGNVVADQ